jgi:hypothetical protein
LCNPVQLVDEGRRVLVPERVKQDSGKRRMGSGDQREWIRVLALMTVTPQIVILSVVP